MDNNNLILIPCDFSPLAYHAMEHGIFMSKAMNCRPLILHVAAQEKELPVMEKKLRFVAEECFDKYGVRPEQMVRQAGQPYSAIKAVTQELNPSLVVLKTDGGSHTIKMLQGTSSPFLVIQGPPENEVLKNIVFPINFLNQHDEKLKRVILFSEYYPDAEMYIITPSGKGTVKEKVIAGNITLMTKVMNQQDIKVNFVTHDDTRNSVEAILKLSKGADMIAIQIEETSSFEKFLLALQFKFGLREEKLIINADKIPILCFNKESDLRPYLK